jgi:dihydrodipicolinate reductase
LAAKREMAVKIAISGAAGRMGRRLLSLCCADKDIELVQAIEYAAHPLMGKVFMKYVLFVMDCKVLMYNSCGAESERD